MSSFTDELEYEFTGRYEGWNPVYAVTKKFSYAVGSLRDPLSVIVVPEGFETDFASIPFPFNKVFRPDGPWAKAAVVHDYLWYAHSEVSSLIRDAVFLEAMIVLGINTVVAHIFYIAVRLYSEATKRIGWRQS